MVTVQSGEEIIGSGLADRPRADLVEAGYGNGDHAFQFPVDWTKLRSVNDIVIRAHAYRNGELSRSRKSSTQLSLSSFSRDDLLAYLNPVAASRQSKLAALLYAVETGNTVVVRGKLAEAKGMHGEAFLQTKHFSNIVVARSRTNT